MFHTYISTRRPGGEKRKTHQCGNLAKVTADSEVALFILVAVGDHYMRARLGWKTVRRQSTRATCRRASPRTVEEDAPSLDTRYLPRKLVHPNTVTVRPVTALRPGGPC